MAPYGYLKAEEITFTIEDTGEIQKVEMKDDVPTGTIIINKNGEFLDKVTALDSVGGWIKHLFQYVTGSLKDVTFEVYALEDVKSADGESEDYYKKMNWWQPLQQMIPVLQNIRTSAWQILCKRKSYRGWFCTG